MKMGDLGVMMLSTCPFWVRFMVMMTMIMMMKMLVIIIISMIAFSLLYFLDDPITRCNSWQQGHIRKY